MEPKRVIEISHMLEVQKPPQLSLDKTFYTIYSPGKFKLQPCKCTVLDLQLKIKLPDEMEDLIFLPPSITKQTVTLENTRRILVPGDDRIIKLELLNRNFHDTVTIKKNQNIAGLVLFNRNFAELPKIDSIKTHYKIFEENN